MGGARTNFPRLTMRFAYIDSQGNEVDIPSEDALRLRIELGAIVDGTSFYDGAADRWGPAGEHDLFRRLKRDLAQPSRSDAASPRPPGALRPDPNASSTGRPPAPPAPPPNGGLASASPPFDGAWPDAPSDEGSAPHAPDHDPPTEEWAGDADPPSPEYPGAGVESAVEEGGSDEPFDFAGFGALDLKDDLTVQPRSSATSPDSPDLGWHTDAGGGAVEAPADPWTMPGREPWPPEPGSFGGPAPAGSGRTIAPGGFQDEETPDWLRDDPDFASGKADDPGGPDRDPGGERAEPRHDDEAGGVRDTTARPAGGSAVRHPRSGGRRAWPRVAAVAGIAALVVAGGVWFLGGGSGAAEAETTEVELPPLAPSLEPVFRTAAGAAEAATVDALAALPFRESLDERPDEAWLGGAYMAGASQYDGVRLYWEAMGRYAQIMQAKEVEVFEASLAAALDSVTLPASDRAAVEARALAGFEAAAPRRGAVYMQVRDVVDASLSLHAFLVQNEVNIDYEPADAGLSRDPLLEAVPISSALGDEMWNRVAGITSALDALGYLDQVTTEGLLAVFFEKLRAVPVK